MSALRVLEGVVRDGVVVPDDTTGLNNGDRVRIVLAGIDLPASLEEELAAWNLAGTDAWKMVDKWEKDEAVESW